jgi:hypothetical protein
VRGLPAIGRIQIVKREDVVKFHFWAAAILRAVAFATPFAADAAGDPSAFFKGRTITIIVGYGPGGGYDLYSRVIARHITDHIPGHPNVIVQNMPGAGSLEATNYVYAGAPKDGTVIACVNQDMPDYQLLDSAGVHYDASRFAWLGAVVASNSIIYTWRAAGVNSWQDAKTKKVILGTTDVSAMAVPRAMNALLGTKFQLLPGYAGTGDIKLAMQRGEITGSGGTTWAGLTLSGQDLIARKLIDLLIQTGPSKEKDLPDVLLFGDLVASGQDKEIAAIISLPSSIGYAYWMSPDAPADRVAVLRQAYRETMQDPNFLSDAVHAHLIVRPQTAEDISARVGRAFATPADALTRTRDILKE